MFGFYRAARFAAAFTLLVSAFAVPAAAAEAGGIQLASLTAIPQAAQNAVSSSFQPQESSNSAPVVEPQGSAAAVLAQPTPDVVEAAPQGVGAQIAHVIRPLRDMVLAFVNFGKQDEQQDCLAKAVYFEARSESLEGQLAVAEVILNRAASGIYPPTICEVVTQPAQFSFIRAGRFPTPDTASSAWHTALAIAEIANKRLSQQIAPNVLWYHATYVAPSWGRRLTRVTQIGTHIFYS
jgi:hypothetical protein